MKFMKLIIWVSEQIVKGRIGTASKEWQLGVGALDKDRRCPLFSLRASSLPSRRKLMQRSEEEFARKETGSFRKRQLLEHASAMLFLPPSKELFYHLLEITRYLSCILRKYTANTIFYTWSYIWAAIAFWKTIDCVLSISEAVPDFAAVPLKYVQAIRIPRQESQQLCSLILGIEIPISKGAFNWNKLFLSLELRFLRLRSFLCMGVLEMTLKKEFNDYFVKERRRWGKAQDYPTLMLFSIRGEWGNLCQAFLILLLQSATTEFEQTLEDS